MSRTPEAVLDWLETRLAVVAAEDSDRIQGDEYVMDTGEGAVSVFTLTELCDEAGDAIRQLREAQGEPVGEIIGASYTVKWNWENISQVRKGTKLYTAPPPPSVPDEAVWTELTFKCDSAKDWAAGWNACRQVMLNKIALNAAKQEGDS